MSPPLRAPPPSGGNGGPVHPWPPPLYADARSWFIMRSWLRTCTWY